MTGLISNGGTPGGSATQLQFNNSGVFGGISGSSTNGIQQITLTGATTTAPKWAVQLTGDTVPRVQIALNASDVGALWFGPGGASAADLFVERAGAANLRHGLPDAAAPVAQTLSVQNVVAGTNNTAGANLTIAGSQGTGTGVGGSLLFQVAPAGSTGSAQNALATVLTIGVTGITQAGNVSAASWTTAGIKLIQSAATYTNTTSTGTVAAQYINLFGVGTLAFTSATTITNAYGTYFMDLVAGSNATLTNKWALGADSASIGGATISSGGIITSPGNVVAGSSSALAFTGRSRVMSSSNGLIELFNNAGSSFTRLNFGGTTSSFPALKVSSATLQGRLADDSAFTFVQAKLQTDTNATTGLTAGVLATLTNASIVIYDATGQAYRVPCVI